jgi:beta-glucuronidase
MVSCFGPERVLLFDDYFDWYAHGGIYRSICWHELPDLSINRAHVRIRDARLGKVEVEVQLAGAISDEIELLARWDERKDERVTLQPVDGKAIWKTSVPEPQLWSPQNPHLHKLQLRLADGSDGIVERIGLREIESREGQLWLNGEPLQLQGVNRHEAQVLTGPVLSTAQKLHDILLLKDLGCNFVRGSHYQQDQEFLDLCDEHGILVWEEGTGWQAREAHFTNPRFTELQQQSLRAMTQSSFNHPSIIIWGFLNEGESFRDSSRPVYECLVQTLRDADDGRLVTSACNHPLTCQNLHLYDLISINMYPGWYPDWSDREAANMHHPFKLIEERLDEVSSHFVEQGLNNKGLLDEYRRPKMAFHTVREYFHKGFIAQR